MKGCKYLLQHYDFNKHYVMFEHNVLKWDAGSYSAFNCQKCLFLAWKDHASKESAVFNRQGFILLPTKAEVKHQEFCTLGKIYTVKSSLVFLYS